MIKLSEVVEEVAKDMARTHFQGGNPYVDLKFISMAYQFPLHELRALVNTRFKERVLIEGALSE